LFLVAAFLAGWLTVAAFDAVGCRVTGAGIPAPPTPCDSALLPGRW
jgi:hypothetical protein